MAILQAYFDDSQSNMGDRYYYLAGYIAQAAVWEEFSQAWDFVLRQPPSAAFVHAVDANALKGEFGGWLVEQRNKKLLDLGKVIEFFKPIPISVRLKQSVFDTYFKPFAPVVA